MLLTYLRRELWNRRRAQLVIASGLALGIALVVLVGSVTSGMQRAQESVLSSLYGVGTDMTVTRTPRSAEEVMAGGEGRRLFEFEANAEEEQRRERIVADPFTAMDASVAEEVAAVEGVAEAIPSLTLTNVTVMGDFAPGEFAPPAGGEGSGAPPGGEGDGDRVTGGGAAFDIDQYVMAGVDVSRPEAGPLGTSVITDGRGFEESDTGERVVVLDATRATSEELATGDTLEISGEDYEVIGIATPDSGEAGAEVYLPLDVAQELAGGDPVISTVYVRVTDSRLIGEVADAVTANIADTEVTTASELAETVSGSLGTAAGLAEGVGRWLSVIVLVVAFGVAGLLAAGAVGRRVREFGTLKALGWSRGRVTRQVTAESMATGLVGGALGLPAGLLGARAISSLAPSLTAEWGAGSLPGAGGLDRITGGFSGGPGGGGPGGAADAGAEGVGGALEVALSAPVDGGLLVTAVLLAVAGGLVAGVFAAWRASRLRPADALRRVA
ncbi:ABC transporter permease [Streptomyces calidiresistens]